MKAPAKKGIHRVNWGLRHSSGNMISPDKDTALREDSKGHLVTPGVYSVDLYALQKEEVNQLSKALSFEVKPIKEQLQSLKNTTLPALEEKLINAGAPLVKEL